MPDRIPIALSNSYHDVLEGLRDQQIMGLIREEGNFTKKIVKGKTYWYHQYTEAGTRKQTYIGAETPDLLARIERHNKAKITEDHRADLIRAITRSGVIPPIQGAVGSVLAGLADSGIFRLRAVLVGTAAFQAYPAILGVRFKSMASFTTEDVDVAQSRAISVAVEDASAPPVLYALKRVNPNFEAILKPGRGVSATSYAAGSLKVEFLTPSRGPVEDAPVSLPALGTQAQPLRFLDFLIYDEMPAAILWGSGILVNVPEPARFAWHKLIISQRRPAFAQAKARKDVLQAQLLFDAMIEDGGREIARIWRELALPGRKTWQEIAMGGFAQMTAEVQEKVRPLI